MEEENKLYRYGFDGVGADDCKITDTHSLLQDLNSIRLLGLFLLTAEDHRCCPSEETQTKDFDMNMYERRYCIANVQNSPFHDYLFI